MNEEIHIHYRCTADDLIAGYRWHYRRRIRAIYRLLFRLLIIGAIVAGAVMTFHLGKRDAGVPLMAFGLYIVIYLRFVRPWLLRRQIEKRPDHGSDAEWRISPRSLHTSAFHGTADIKWEGLHEVVETPEGFLLYQMANLFYWLPRRAFSSESDFERLSLLARERAKTFRHIDR